MLVVNALAMGNPDDQHDQFVVLNVADHAVIPHPVTPQSSEIARQWLAETVWYMDGHSKRRGFSLFLQFMPGDRVGLLSQ